MAFNRDQAMPPNAAFGRRASSQAQPVARSARTRAEPVALPETTPSEQSAFEDAPVADTPSLDDELREWKRNRKAGFEMPWRQISLMASLCFGVASLVLPKETNDAVNWLLYGLMAISFAAGISRRRRKRAETAKPV